MSLFISLGIFVAAILLMAAMLLRKDALIKRGVVFVEERKGETHAPFLFSLLHDLERALLSFSARAGSRAVSHAHALTKRGMRAVVEKTPAGKIVAAVSGKTEQNGARAEPSAYLKDVTNHRDQMRSNGSRDV